MVPVGRYVGRWAWQATWFVLLAAVAIALLSWSDLAPAYEARFGDDAVVGAFSAEEVRCEEIDLRHGPDIVCDEFGTFRSDDGSVVLPGASYAGWSVLDAGDVVRGAYTGASAEDDGEEWPVVYPVDGGWDWLFETAVAAGAVALLVVALVVRPGLMTWRRTGTGRRRTSGWRLLRWLRIG